MATEPVARSNVIDTEGLTKVYAPGGDGDELTAVSHLDLSVRRGEIFGLLGPNGAGKTTTVGMLTTRVVPTSGKAWVRGVDVVAQPQVAKQYIGVVQQVNTLDRSLNAWENLYFHGRYHGLSAKRARDAADSHLEMVRLTHRSRSPVRSLSGGMARRLMIARAVLHHPAVLFLDEPTAGLDPQSRLALWEIVRDLHDQGQTILLTTHYIEEADEFCDRVAIMDHGRILALDTPARLKQSVAQAQGAAPDVKAWLMQLWGKARALEPSLVVDGGVLARPGLEDDLVALVRVAGRLGLELDGLGGGTTLESVFFSLTGRDIRE